VESHEAQWALRADINWPGCSGRKICRLELSTTHNRSYSRASRQTNPARRRWRCGICRRGIRQCFDRCCPSRSRPLLGRTAADRSSTRSCRTRSEPVVPTDCSISARCIQRNIPCPCMVPIHGTMRDTLRGKVHLCLLSNFQTTFYFDNLLFLTRRNGELNLQRSSNKIWPQKWPKQNEIW